MPLGDRRVRSVHSEEAGVLSPSRFLTRRRGGHSSLDGAFTHRRIHASIRCSIAEIGGTSLGIQPRRSSLSSGGIFRISDVMAGRRTSRTGGVMCRLVTGVKESLGNSRH